jgi:hypothetical protein
MSCEICPRNYFFTGRQTEIQITEFQKADAQKVSPKMCFVGRGFSRDIKNSKIAGL